MDKTTLTKRVKEKARELGFELVGVTSSESPAHLDVYRRWLNFGRQGEMEYLEGQRAYTRRADPKLILPECKSILALAMPYDNPAKRTHLAKSEGRVAAYAWGTDYHEVIPPRLKELVEFLETEYGHSVPNRWYTDTGPILERELAQRAGLGWIGKNTMLINPQRGSYFLLAEIFLGIELEIDEPMTSDHCGKCRRCIEACPTNCILEDRTLDAKRCISYLTIEHKGAIDDDLRPQMGDWAFGCDVCQVVCPWNERFAHSHGDPDLAGSNSSSKLEEELRLSAGQFNLKYKSSAIKRTKRRGYLRNLTIVAGNANAEESLPALTGCLSDDEPLVRGHAAWALGQIGGADARAALEQAKMRESNSRVQEEIQAAIKLCSQFPP